MVKVLLIYAEHNIDPRYNLTYTAVKGSVMRYHRRESVFPYLDRWRSWSRGHGFI